MTHLTVHEWKSVKVGAGDKQFTRTQADALHAAACAHPQAHEGGANILVYGRDRLIARQMVGMVAASGPKGGCSLEILPKVDSGLPEPDDKEAVDQERKMVRARLVRMLDVALGLKLEFGSSAAIARQNDTLLEILIRHFSDALLAEVRRGLPRQYIQQEDDLPALRGRLDVMRQFTRNAVRPDRLACRYDELSSDTPLMRIMAAATVFLRKHARGAETQRKLDELRHIFVHIPLVSVARLPWKAVRIDRTNRRWESLFSLAKLLIQRDYQTTHHGAADPEGLTLLFPMNDLFEKYIAVLLRRALSGTGIDVQEQGIGGRLNCLATQPDTQVSPFLGDVFLTKPDIVLRHDGKAVAIIDTKWKNLAADPLAKKHGIAQADVYQLMAYARLYECDQLMLLYPATPGMEGGERTAFGMAGGHERLSIATVDISRNETHIVDRLRELCASKRMSGTLVGTL